MAIHVDCFIKGEVDSDGLHMIEHVCPDIILQSSVNPVLLAESLLELGIFTEEDKRGVVECECREDQFNLLFKYLSRVMTEGKIRFYKIIAVISRHDNDFARKLMVEFKRIKSERYETERQTQIEKESEEESVSRKISEMRRMLDSHPMQCQLGRHRPQ